MGTITNSVLNRAFDSLGILDEIPGFLEAVCEQSGKLYLVEGRLFISKVERLVLFDFSEHSEDIVLLPPTQIRSLTVGDPLPYIFALSRERLLVGTSRELARQLKEELPTLDPYPHTKTEVENFIHEVEQMGQ